MSEDRIRVLVVDDHLIVREGLRAILGAHADIEVIGEAKDGGEAVQSCLALRPDVVLMDITMPGMSGMEATRLIKETCPEARVLVLTMHESDDYFFEMLSAGASGYFVKGGSSAELVSALRAVHRGDVFLYPTMAKKLLTDYWQKAKAAQARKSDDGLTDREREILKLIAEGKSTQEIAEQLVLSTATVQTHRSRIMAKLGLHTRTELVKFALKRGYIDLDT
ncbi:MAG: response regulator transcription factor [Chloroflexi bacterium]|nr:response regulator transcription factor [Chloroflexota bacterium]